VSSLAYLATVPIEEVKGLGGSRGATMRKAGLATVADLLLHVPHRYADRSQTEPIALATVGEEITVTGRVTAVRSRRPRANLLIVEALVSDGTAEVKAVWFNQKFRSNLQPGTEVALGGRLERFKGQLQMKSPALDELDSGLEGLRTGRVVPVHTAVGKIDPGHLRRYIHTALRRASPITDPLPEEMRRRFGLLPRQEALTKIHFPATFEEIPAARRRLIFDELFRLELALALQKRHQMEQARGMAHVIEGELVDSFLAGLPYSLTAAQRRVLAEITTDLASPHPMHRLLLGEVGSGKTVVAVATLLVGIQGGGQGAIMAPTEVLAEQHFLSVRTLLEQAGLSPPVGSGHLGMDGLFATTGPAVRMALLTSSRAQANFDAPGGRSQIVEAIAAGGVDLVVGTHALIQEGVRFPRLAVSVVDEQHRFGVGQRVQLKEKAVAADPDLLIMTATPIPRTLAMTLYGDLDVSVIDELPPGRRPVRTIALPAAAEDRAWEMVRTEVAAGRQAFVVCLLVEDSPKIELASATAEYQRLQRVLDGLRLGLVHGQLPSRDKEAVMAEFRRGGTDVLVSTTVIEVGIDVPNATVMVIEDADRFGLSQLHQLRGRVGRGEHPGTCVLIADASTEEAAGRIEALVRTSDGFLLAEEDLRLRGQGTVFGARQAGLPDLRLANILRDRKELAVARREAFALVDRDPELADHPGLREEVGTFLADRVEWLFRS
jgi:ATP-dependent DNA helicase RecG